MNFVFDINYDAERVRAQRQKSAEEYQKKVRVRQYIFGGLLIAFFLSGYFSRDFSVIWSNILFALSALSFFLLGSLRRIAQRLGEQSPLEKQMAEVYKDDPKRTVIINDEYFQRTDYRGERKYLWSEFTKVYSQEDYISILNDERNDNVIVWRHEIGEEQFKQLKESLAKKL